MLAFNEAKKQHKGVTKSQEQKETNINKIYMFIHTRKKYNITTQKRWANIICKSWYAIINILMIIIKNIYY